MRAGLKLSGRYALQAPLGGGGMGEVWRGVDEQLDRPVAVKVLREHLADPELAGRFRREARIGARLQHPGITVVHDVGVDHGQLFIVMELLQGRDLAAMLAQAPVGMPIDATVSLIIQAAEALQAAHAGHVVHRDLKPANLFVLDSGRVKICDFGIACAVDATSHLTATGQTIGTPAYMSPEQCLGRPVDERSDLYSLGCVLYALLTGRPPFTEGQPLAIMSQHINAAPKAPRTIRPDVPTDLDRIVMEMLAKDPAHRPADASYVIATLGALHYTPTVKVEPTAKAGTRFDLNLLEPPGNASGFQLAGSDGTVSATMARLPSATPAQSAAITRVPRAEAERREVLLARPGYWEYLYFAGQLLHERNRVEAKYRDHELHRAPASREVVTGGEIASYIAQLNDADSVFDYITQRFRDAAGLAKKMTGLFDDKVALERAFGAPGEEGDPERLAHLAKRWNNVYEEFLDWAASLRGASAPSECRNLLELAARYADEPVEKYRHFVDEYVAQVDVMYDAIPAAIAAGEPIRIGASIILSRREEVINDYVTELNRLRRQHHAFGDEPAELRRLRHLADERPSAIGVSALQELRQCTEKLTKLMRGYSKYVNEATEQIRQAKNSDEILAVNNKLADNLIPIAQEYFNLARVQQRLEHIVDQDIQTMLQVIKATPREQRDDGTADLLASLRDYVQSSLDRLNVIQRQNDSMDSVKGNSPRLDECLQRMQAANVMMLSNRGIHKILLKELEDLRLDA